MARPCILMHPRSPKTCKLCALLELPGARGDRFRARWGEEASVADPFAAFCKHLGRDTGEKAECKGCHEPSLQPIHVCALYGLCTISLESRPIACCRRCADRQPV